MKREMAIALLAAALAGGAAHAQTPDNPDRKETARERDNDERRPDPAERNNTGRIDPLMFAELQKCYAVPDAERERCIAGVKRKFGVM
jgi:hypothetical protein